MTVLMTPSKTFLITPPDEVDLSTQDQLSDLLDQFAATDEPSPHVDLSTVTFMDCTGLNFLVTLRRASAARGGIVTLLHPHPNVLRLLQLVQFDTVFVIISWPRHELPLTAHKQATLGWSNGHARTENIDQNGPQT